MPNTLLDILKKLRDQAIKEQNQNAIDGFNAGIKDVEEEESLAAKAQEERKIAAENARQARLDTIPYRGRFDEDDDYEDYRGKMYLAEKYRQEQRARNHERWHREVSPFCEPGYCPYRGLI